MSRKNRHTRYNASTLRHTKQRKPGAPRWFALDRFVPPIRTKFGQSEANLAPKIGSSGLSPDLSWVFPLYTGQQIKFRPDSTASLLPVGFLHVISVTRPGGSNCSRLYVYCQQLWFRLGAGYGSRVCRTLFCRDEWCRQLGKRR